MKPKDRCEIDNAFSRFIGSEVIAPITSFGTQTVGVGASTMKLPIIVLEQDFAISKDTAST